jgi:hypothetical protein
MYHLVLPTSEVPLLGISIQYPEGWENGKVLEVILIIISRFYTLTQLSQYIAWMSWISNVEGLD